MTDRFRFTFREFEAQYRAVIDAGYSVMTCADYASQKDALPSLTAVNRVDIDFSVKKAERQCDIFNKLGIHATFFVRLHAPEYNPFSFENYRILRKIRDSGHEIGYHSEIIDQAAIWGEDASDCLRRDVDILNRMLDIDIQGVASHGGMTGLNNLDFWKSHAPSEFGLRYEAYEETDRFNLFKSAFYVSDSEWTRWKCYDRGVLQQGDTRSIAEHVASRHPLLYLLVHPDSYFDRHFYE